jgi:hypothetical protein
MIACAVANVVEADAEGRLDCPAVLEADQAFVHAHFTRGTKSARLTECRSSRTRAEKPGTKTSNSLGTVAALTRTFAVAG